MQSAEQAQSIVARLVERARKAGADAADAVYVGERSSEVQVRLGALEDVQRSEGEQLGLRLFRGQRSASVSASDLSEETLGQLVERAMAMAGEAPEDPFAGLADPSLLAGGPWPDLDLDDGGDPGSEVLRERALAAEEAARAVPGVSNSNGASASASASIMALATSHGFAAATRSTGYGCSASVVAGEGGRMQRDHGWHTARHATDLEQPEAIGRRAGERAVARLDPVRPSPGRKPVLFDARVAASLLGHLMGAINGAAIARRSSFLLDALGTAVFAPGVTISDDPLRPRGLRSRAFDGEGLATRPTELVADGVLTGWLAASAAARQLGIAPTGHAVRGVSGAPGAGPSNLYLHAGGRSREAMIAELDDAILVTELIGHGVNGVTGDYSRGASGFLIVKGEIGPPVSEITIASNLKAMFATLEPASDLVFRRGTDSPSLLVPDMAIGSA